TAREVGRARPEHAATQLDETALGEIHGVAEGQAPDQADRILLTAARADPPQRHPGRLAHALPAFRPSTTRAKRLARRRCSGCRTGGNVASGCATTIAIRRARDSATLTRLSS